MSGGKPGSGDPGRAKLDLLIAGQLPDFYSHYDRDWKTYNARLVTKYKRDDFAELLASVEDSLQELAGYLETIPAEEFDKDRGVRYKRYKVTIARLLQAEIKDEKKTSCAN